MILCANPGAQYVVRRAEIDSAIARVLEKGVYIKGSEVESFEREFASYIGVGYGVGVANGTDALRLSLLACGVGAGDEVITVSHTAVATVAAVEQSGAQPVLVDIEPEFYTLAPERLRAAFTPRTKAVIAVHLYGQSFDLVQIAAICREKGVRLIEDCAQSTGAVFNGKRLGSFGDLSCFSFYPTKNLGAIGDGGMVLTDDAHLAEKIRLLREYGWKERFISELPGWNSRLDELQAAVLRVKLPYLDSDNAKRQQIAEFYQDALAGFDFKLPRSRGSEKSVFHLYVLRTQNRDRLLSFLKSEGIQAGIHYPMPVHLQPAYRGRIRLVESMQETERASGEIISLPLYPELTSQETAAVVQALRRWQQQEGRA